VADQVETGLGKRYRHVVPLAVTIFMLVLAANWVELFPGCGTTPITSHRRPPTSI